MTNFCKLSERQCWCSWVLRILCVAVPFTVFFFEARLNIETRLNDYELIKLHEQRRTLETELLNQNSLLSQMKPKDFLDRKAEELGLQSPDVDQYQLVQYREVPKRAPALRLDHIQIAHPAPVAPTHRMEVAHRPDSETLPPAAPAASAATPRMETTIEPVVIPVPVEADAELIDEDPELSYMSASDMLAQL